jgi:hypothetical protein
MSSSFVHRGTVIRPLILCERGRYRTTMCVKGLLNYLKNGVKSCGNSTMYARGICRSSHLRTREPLTGLRCAPWPSSGFGSGSAAGRIALPTTSRAASTRSGDAAHRCSLDVETSNLNLTLYLRAWAQQYTQLGDGAQGGSPAATLRFPGHRAAGAAARRESGRAGGVPEARGPAHAAPAPPPRAGAASRPARRGLRPARGRRAREESDRAGRSPAARLPRCQRDGSDRQGGRETCLLLSAGR